MKAIQTKSLSWTNTKPSRIKASAEGVKSIIYTRNSLEDELIRAGQRVNEKNLHNLAANKFAHAYVWLLDGENGLVSGGYGDGLWFHCFTSK